MVEGDAIDAAARADAWFASFDRLDVEALSMTTLPAAEDPERAAARERARAMASDRGLTDLLADARARARGAVFRRFDEGGYRPTMLGLNWGVSEGTAQDRVAAALAAEDAVTAAIIEPFSDEVTLAALASPFELVHRGREVRTEFDLTRATADRLQRRSGDTVAVVIVIVLSLVAIGGLGVVAGSWPLALLVLLVGIAVVAFLRRRQA